MINQKGLCLKHRWVRAHLAARGFTIIELIITLLVGAIALTLALPSLLALSASNQVIAANNSIISGLNMARNQAIISGNNITICPSSNGTTCLDSSWDKGWIVFNDMDADSVADAAEVLRVIDIDGEIATSGYGEQIIFQPNGTTTMGSNATITNCYSNSEISGKCLAINVNRFGMIDSTVL